MAETHTIVVQSSGAENDDHSWQKHTATVPDSVAENADLLWQKYASRVVLRCGAKEDR